MLTEIFTERFILRPLNVNDVGENYAGWLSDNKTSQYITAKINLADLRQYVTKRSGREDILFLGIFLKESKLHIGNIKFEPVEFKLGYAIMGILIGESDWRGKGVAKEVIYASASWLHKNRNIKEIILGVNRSNNAAILAYQKIGFVEMTTKFIPFFSSENMTMVWHLNKFSSH
jgi:ribosomal-protein-alanine N-acetyltransferase